MNRVGNIAETDDPIEVDDKYADYSYLGAGTVVKVTHPAVTGGLDLNYGTDGTYGGFDRFGRIIDQKWQNTAATTTHDRYQYGYDVAGNRTWRENTIRHSAGNAPKLDEYYTYDGLDRLKNVDRGTLTGTPPYSGISGTPGREQDWTLSQTGNWTGFVEKTSGNTDLDQSREHNKANEIADTSGNSDAIETTTGSDWIDPAHDLAGNMILAPKPGDEATATEALVIKYDAWNRPAKVYKDNGTTSGQYDATDTLIAEYQYNGQHKRIVKLLPNGENWKRTDYYYNKAWQCIEERYNGNVAGKTTVATAVKTQYVWDIRYIDAVVMRWHDGNDDGDFTDANEVLYYTNDANMNVTALVNTSGDAVERYIYDAYGKVTVLDADWSVDADGKSDFSNEILYCGYRYDPETGLYHVRNRYYHPTLGRWLTTDPLNRDVPGGYHDGMSLYEYVKSLPILLLDPSGTTYYLPSLPAADYSDRSDYKDKILAIIKRGRIGVEECCDIAKAYCPLYKRYFSLQNRLWQLQDKERDLRREIERLLGIYQGRVKGYTEATLAYYMEVEINLALANKAVRTADEVYRQFWYNTTSALTGVPSVVLDPSLRNIVTDVSWQTLLQGTNYVMKKPISFKLGPTLAGAIQLTLITTYDIGDIMFKVNAAQDSLQSSGELASSMLASKENMQRAAQNIKDKNFDYQDVRADIKENENIDRNPLLMEAKLLEYRWDRGDCYRHFKGDMTLVKYHCR